MSENNTNLKVSEIRKIHELLELLHKVTLTSEVLKEEAKATYNTFASYLDDSSKLS